MNPVKTIKPSKKYIKKQFTYGTIVLTLGIIGLAIGTLYMLLGIGILVLVVTSFQKDRDVIKIFEDNIEVKFAPVSSIRFIKFSDMQRVEKISASKTILIYQDGEKEKKLRIPVAMIDSADLEYLIELMDSKINSAT